MSSLARSDKREVCNMYFKYLSIRPIMPVLIEASSDMLVHSYRILIEITVGTTK